MRTVAIVGDSRGIGAALREQLLGQDVRVIGVSRTGVQREGGEHPNYQSLVFDAVAHPCDVSGFTDRLDGLVYCPGTIKLKPLRGLKAEQFEEDFRINVLGAVQSKLLIRILFLVLIPVLVGQVRSKKLTWEALYPNPYPNPRPNPFRRGDKPEAV